MKKSTKQFKALKMFLTSAITFETQNDPKEKMLWQHSDPVWLFNFQLSVCSKIFLTSCANGLSLNILTPRND